MVTSAGRRKTRSSTRRSSPNRALIFRVSGPLTVESNASLPHDRCVDELEAEHLALAQWAVERWSALPVDADPRPIVLIWAPIESDGGFRSQDAKDAWFDGRYEWAVEVPDGVMVRARMSADREPQEPVGPPLRITQAGQAEHEFVTDRGLVTLPAYWLKGPSITGALWVLDPKVKYWEPAEDAAGLRPRASRCRQPLMRTSFNQVQAGADGRTVTIPGMGGDPKIDHLELIETPNAISAVVTRGPRTSRPGFYTYPSKARDPYPGHLSEPVGNRVFVDLSGEAMRIGVPGV